MLRAIRLIVLGLILLLGGAWAYAWVSRAPEQSVGEAFPPVSPSAAPSA
jgi:hypothetical protein